MMEKKRQFSIHKKREQLIRTIVCGGEEEELQEVVIEKNIPIPPVGTKTGKWQQVLSRMDIGDSFAIKLNKDDLKFGRINRASVIANAAKSLDMKMRTMKIGNILRVWRIE